MNAFSVKELPIDERPRERLLKLGGESLASSELLAVLLGQGTKGKSVLELSQELLLRFGSLKGLAEATVTELCQIKGLGKAKAIQIKAALSLASRINRTSEEKYSISTPRDVFELVKQAFQFEKKEKFGVVLQDIRGKVITWEVITIGILTKTLVHPREVFHFAIRNQAAGLILVHNHPSGDLTPSAEDIQVTQTLLAAGKLMGIPIHDHLIISEVGFFSMRESGLI